MRPLSRYQDLSLTPILVAVDGELVAALGLSDVVKPEAAQVVARLRSLGIETWMITGDNIGTAHAVAAQVGIPPARVMAQVLPASKSRKVQELQQKGRVVAMVGDGINDAPALAQVGHPVGLWASLRVWCGGWVYGVGGMGGCVPRTLFAPRADCGVGWCQGTWCVWCGVVWCGVVCVECGVCVEHPLTPPCTP
jgi:hypothetical protein